MPVETELREDGNVVYFRVNDPWTMEDLFKGFAQSTALRDRVYQTDSTRRVHTLLDLMDARQAPPGILQGRKMPGVTHVSHGEFVVAAKYEYPRSIAQTMLRLMRTEGRFFDSLEDAWDYLRRIIQTPTTQNSSEGTDKDSKSA